MSKTMRLETMRLMRWSGLGATALSVLLPGAAMAVDSGPDMARLATYAGADRQQILVDGAKKEGVINLYTSIPIPDVSPATDAFTKKYGIRVNVWRAGSEQVLQRILTEATGGRHEFDATDTNGPQLEAMVREQLLQKVESPVFANLRAGAVQAHRSWTTTRVNVFAQAYNTNLVKKDELPRDWGDLLNPKWKGKLGIEVADSDWFSAVIKQVGDEQKGLDLFRQIVRTNGVSVRKGHTMVTNLVVAGEIPLALTTYHYEPETLKKSGAPIEWYSIGKVVVRPNGSAVARRAPHPHAALLFYDFMLSEGQKLLATRNIEVMSKEVPSAIGDLPQQSIDSAEILDDFAKWERLYNEIFVNQSR